MRLTPYSPAGKPFTPCDSMRKAPSASVAPYPIGRPAGGWSVTVAPSTGLPSSVTRPSTGYVVVPPQPTTPALSKQTPAARQNTVLGQLRHLAVILTSQVLVELMINVLREKVDRPV